MKRERAFFVRCAFEGCLQAPKVFHAGQAWCYEPRHAPLAQRKAAVDVRAFVTAELRRLRALASPRVCEGCGQVEMLGTRRFCIPCGHARVRTNKLARYRQTAVRKRNRPCGWCGKGILPARTHCYDCREALTRW